MLRFIARRLALIPFVLLGMTLVTFTASQIIPRDPVAAFLGSRYEGGNAPEAELEAIKEKWGWDKPWIERYGIYIGNVFQGDLGVSTSSHRAVSDDLRDFAPATFELVIATMIVTILVAVPLGVASAAARGRLVNGAFILGSVLVAAAPIFWLALLAERFFYRDLGWVPGPGRLDIFLTEPPSVTGFLTIDSLLDGDGAAFWNAVEHLLLPAGLLGCVMGIYVARILRTELRAVMTEDFVRTARGKGLSETRVLWRHGLRNAIIPVLTISGLIFGALLTGTIVIETVFGWPGLGSYAFRAAGSLDLAGISGVVLITGTIYLVVNLIVDVLYAFADPRVRLT